MKRHLNFSYLALGIFALLLGACAKEGLDIGSRSAFQVKAEQSLRNITARVTGLKGVRRVRSNNTGIQDLSLYYSNPSSNWQPYNNVFMRSGMRDELAEGLQLLMALAPTIANHQARVILAFQLALQASHYRDPMMTGLYRNSTPIAQDMWEYDMNWRFPQSFGSYQNYQTGYNGMGVPYGGQQGFGYMQTYGNYGYIPQTISYR